MSVEIIREGERLGLHIKKIPDLEEDIVDGFLYADVEQTYPVIDDYLEELRRENVVSRVDPMHFKETHYLANGGNIVLYLCEVSVKGVEIKDNGIGIEVTNCPKGIFEDMETILRKLRH